MRIGIVGLVVLGVAGLALAGDRGPRRGRGGIGVVVPVDPREHQRLQWFGRRDHQLVPGTVTINKAPYACDEHLLPFDEREVFIAHLRREHGLTPSEIPDRLLVEDGIVHFFEPAPATPVDSR
jgi:hypothetical protein